MKNQILSRTMALIAVFSFTVLFPACQKTEEVQTFSDVFNTSKIQTLNDLVAKSISLADLSEEFLKVDISIPAGLSDITVTDMILAYEKNIVLSGAEVDLLLKNDITTFLQVTDRMSGLPVQLKALNIDFNELKKSSLSKFLLIQKQEPDQYYIDDYYHSVIELQNYMKNYVIQPLKDFNKLAEKSTMLKSAQTEPDPTLTYQLIVSNNNWDMWWTYQLVGKKISKTKHKGAAGSFPG